MQDFNRSIIVGVIFDISSINHLNLVKESLIKYLVDSEMSTRMYVYRQDWLNIPRDQGESVYYVTSYKEVNFNIDLAFKTTVKLLGEQNENAEKVVLLITDRFLAPNNNRYRKGFLSNTIRGYDSKIVVFGLPEADRETLQRFVAEYDSKYLDINEPANIGTELFNLMEQK